MIGGLLFGGSAAYAAGVMAERSTNPIFVDGREVQMEAYNINGTKYVPKAGDVLLCDDGTLYEIRDISRFENNVLAPGALPELPPPTCDWSRFPDRELPKIELPHFSDAAGDDLFVRNPHETRRMQYTIYNALGNEPTAWRDGKPLATVELDTPGRV